MARHQGDLVRCARIPGVSGGRVCAAHDGRCVVCDSMVRPVALARVCDGCGLHGGGERCVVCHARGVADAYYCKECVQMEKDRDGCPAVVNIGAARTDAFYGQKKCGFKARA